jgi:phosphoribosylformylglycinamidine synthase
MGGTTGRDGINGVTFASEELTSDSETEDRPAVQVGDPFTKKRVMEASYEILDKINVSGVKDLGGGGLTCCISELAGACENGAIVDLNAIPLRETGMTPYEIMLSESQERMVFVINPEDVDLATEICNKHEISSAVIGKVTEGNNMIVKDFEKNQELCNLPTIVLSDPPTIDRPIKEPVKDEKHIEVEDVDFKEGLLKILSSPNIASKIWVYRQYDYEVQLRTAVKPGDDAAVLKIDDNTGVALTVDSNPIHTKLSPFDGGAGSVAEGIRNIVSVGATPYAVVDCLNFGNPENPEILWQFKECIEGMSQVAEKFNAPVISGNVSFYNENEGAKINPTPAVGLIGVLDLENIRTLDFKNESDKIIVIGKTYDEIDGSEYHRTLFNLEQGEAPKIRIDDESDAANTILKLLDEDNDKNITAIHDCSAGGIAIALSEMAIKSGLGAEINTSNIPVDSDMKFNNLLFSESHGRYILTVKSDAVDDILSKINVPAACIGEVKGNGLVFDNINIPVEELVDSYTNVIESYMK